VRIGFLGPEGTYSHQALREAPSPAGSEALPQATIYGTIMAVHDGDVDLALVPIENALEGSVDVTLDTLARDAEAVAIIGETVQRIRNCLIAAEPGGLGEIERIHSHPQATAQCAGFLRAELPRATIVASSSTAEAVRNVALARDPKQAALGNRLAAELYGAHVLRGDIDDEPDNVTRFVWLARSERAAELRALVSGSDAETKTSIVFWGAGDEAPGWLVSCLGELAERDISLTRIESRPRRVGLGHYMFFADLEGAAADRRLVAAIDGLRGRCQEVRVLGSYLAA
jgi:prephenate dehydratase